MTDDKTQPNQNRPGAREPRKKTDEEKQQEKDAMINLWMGDMGGSKSEPPKQK